jgi:hypothetical protein
LVFVIPFHNGLQAHLIARVLLGSEVQLEVVESELNKFSVCLALLVCIVYCAGCLRVFVAGRLDGAVVMLSLLTHNKYVEGCYSFAFRVDGLVAFLNDKR